MVTTFVNYPAPERVTALIEPGIFSPGRPDDAKLIVNRLLGDGEPVAGAGRFRRVLASAG